VNKLSRKERRARRRAKKLAAKIAARPIELLDRGPTTRLVVGPINKFSADDIEGLIDREQYASSFFIVVFSGDGYRDVDRCGPKFCADACVRHFKVAYPKVQITWC